MLDLLLQCRGDKWACKERDEGNHTLQTYYLPQALLRDSGISPESIAILESLLELDQGYVIVIKFRNSFVFFPIDVVVGMK